MKLIEVTRNGFKMAINADKIYRFYQPSGVKDKTKILFDAEGDLELVIDGTYEQLVKKIKALNKQDKQQ